MTISVLSIVLTLLPILPCSSTPSFHFSEDLQCIECKVGRVLPEGELLFCILGHEGKPYGVMPAVFLKKKDGAREEIWRDRDRGFNPWKIEIVELDDDPDPEIAIGVYKKTRRDPNQAKRLFIYDWTGHCLAAKWLGSSLSLPMEDFKFLRPDGTGHHQLVALGETAEFKLIRKYRWNGFGFTAIETVLCIRRNSGLDQLYEFFTNL